MAYLPTAAAKQPNGYATSTSNQTIGNESWTTITLNILESTSYDVTLDTNALVINTAGYYEVYGAGKLDQDGNGGIRAIKLQVDTGSGFVDADEDNERESNAGAYQEVRIPAGHKWFDSGDEIRVQVFQDTGGDATLYTDKNNTNLKVIRVSI